MKEKTKLEGAFDLFVSQDHHRPVMTKPFIVGNKTYATDAYVLICCENDKIDFYFENNEKPLDVSKVIPPIQIDEVIEVDKIDWISLMSIPETIGDGGDVECGNCSGEGSIDDSTYYKGKLYSFEYECPVCNGSGMEEEERQVLTGNKTFKSKDAVMVKNVKFRASSFYKLKQVKDLIGGDVKILNYNEDKRGVLFGVGFVEILIMPHFFYEGEDFEIIANF